MLTYFGAASVGFMMLCYALESRGAIYTLLFALGCFAASAYGWLAGTWPFGVVELVWGFVALRKWQLRTRGAVE
jgi:hypothetical protein